MNGLQMEVVDMYKPTYTHYRGKSKTVHSLMDIELGLLLKRDFEACLEQQANLKTMLKNRSIGPQNFTYRGAYKFRLLKNMSKEGQRVKTNTKMMSILGSKKFVREFPSQRTENWAWNSRRSLRVHPKEVLVQNTNTVSS